MSSVQIEQKSYANIWMILNVEGGPGHANHGLLSEGRTPPYLRTAAP
jgi:hypothetical protein